MRSLGSMVAPLACLLSLSSPSTPRLWAEDEHTLRAAAVKVDITPSDLTDLNAWGGSSHGRPRPDLRPSAGAGQRRQHRCPRGARPGGDGRHEPGAPAHRARARDPRRPRPHHVEPRPQCAPRRRGDSWRAGARAEPGDGGLHGHALRQDRRRNEGSQGVSSAGTFRVRNRLLRHQRQPRRVHPRDPELEAGSQPGRPLREDGLGPQVRILVRRADRPPVQLRGALCSDPRHGKPERRPCGGRGAVCRAAVRRRGRGPLHHGASGRSEPQDHAGRARWWSRGPGRRRSAGWPGCARRAGAGEHADPDRRGGAVRRRKCDGHDAGSGGGPDGPADPGHDFVRAPRSRRAHCFVPGEARRRPDE